MGHRLLEGGYDLHIHTGPDVNERKLDDFEMAERAIKLGLKGFGIKSHYFCSAERARLVKKIYPDVTPIGALTLNHSSGGLNPAAVDMAARDGAKIIWMPTFDAANELEYMFNQSSYEQLPPWAKLQFELKEQGKATSGITIWDDDKIKNEVLEILSIIKEQNLILATGHLGKKETYAIVQKAKEMGLKKVVVTHPTFSSIQFTKEEQLELTQMGAFMEQCYGVIAPHYGIDWPELYETMHYVGTSKTILSSDLGQTDTPYPDEGMIDFVERLAANGFSDEEIRQMTVENTSFLVD
ncbi:DUF6282 family protein [Rummeliibacillus sp. JY-2-4R]